MRKKKEDRKKRRKRYVQKDVLVSTKAGMERKGWKRDGDEKRCGRGEWSGVWRLRKME